MAAAATAPKAKARARRRSARRSPAGRARGGSAARAPVARGHLIPLAVGRTAVAVSHLPDTRAIVGLTRGRAWIALLGVLLIGIVGLNVATLGLTATAGDIEQQIRTLEQENSVLRTRIANRLSHQRVQREAALLGLAMPSPGEINYRQAGPEAVATAARRLAASG